MIALLDLSLKELAEFLTQNNEPSYRAKQIYSWLYKGASFDEMTNLSKDLREKLKSICKTGGVSIYESFTSKLDGTIKYLFRLDDDNVIEGVLLKYNYGYTLCISSQVGCRMGCSFCASTLEGLIRNLTAGEIAGQIIAANRSLGFGERQINNIVIMGSGEPLDNYDNIIKFLKNINDKEGLGISLRNITLSTCGLVDKIYKLADEELPVTLSISLHAPNDEIRSRTMPVSKAYSISSIMEAAHNYVAKTGRRVTFEYALIDGVNDSISCAEELAKLLRGLQCHVNLIPLNAVKENNLESSKSANIKSFYNKLNDLNISTTIRREMGSDISGACGQLRRKHIKEGN